MFIDIAFYFQIIDIDLFTCEASVFFTSATGTEQIAILWH